MSFKEEQAEGGAHDLQTRGVQEAAGPAVPTNAFGRGVAKTSMPK